MREPKSISCFPFRQGRPHAQASARRLVPSAARLHENHGAMQGASRESASRRPRGPSSGEASEKDAQSTDPDVRQKRTGAMGNSAERVARDTAFDSGISPVAPTPASQKRERPKSEREQQRRRRGSLALPPVWGGRTGPASIPALYLCPSAHIGTFNQRASGAPAAAAAARGRRTGRKLRNCG